MEFRSQIEAAAERHNLDPLLIEAIADKESSGDPYAWNPEPRYRYLWDVRKRAPFRPLTQIEIVSKFPPRDFPTLAGDPDQEFWGQQASWGLTQIMGAVARENGFTGRYLTQLVNPEINLSLACKHLSGLIRWARGHYTGLVSVEEHVIRLSVLAAWNGGKSGNLPTSSPLRNLGYAKDAYERYQRLKEKP